MVFPGVLNGTFPTGDLAAVELEPQRDAVLPRLRSDPDEAGQDGLRDAIEDHLSGVRVSMEHLQKTESRMLRSPLPDKWRRLRPEEPV